MAEVVLNAPEKLNALGESAIAELRDAYDQAEAARVRARAARRGRAFCAGRDIAGVDPRDDDVQATSAGSSSPC